MNRLVRSALEDESVEHFILLSESTVPVRTFDQVYDRLAAEPRSIFCYAPDAECWPRCEPLLEHLPRSAVKKTHQWAILNRRHARLVIEREAECLPWFEDIFAADEHFWICMLHHLGLEGEVADWMSTYVDWSRGRLRAFDRLSVPDMDTILASDALFARKFPPGSNARRLWRRVEGGRERAPASVPAETPGESIWLFGDGRSGTSWLSNVINYDQRLSYFFEPFHFGDPELSQRVRDLHRLKYVPVDLQDPALEAVVEELLEGRFGTSRTPRPSPRRGVLVKDIYANLFLAWMHARWPSTKKVLLIRHPFAVACSKRQLEGRAGWRFVRRPAAILAQSDLRRDFLAPFESLFGEVAEGFEEHVLAWAVNHYVPLRQLGPDDVHVVFYEELLEDPEPTLEALFRYLYSDEWERHRWPAPKAAVEAPSRSSRSSRVFSLDAWESMISPSERSAGREILRCFGLDGIYLGDERPRRSVVEALLRGEGPKPRLPETRGEVLWLEATALSREGKGILLVGSEAECGDLKKALEARGWSFGTARTALDPLDLSTRSAHRVAAAGEALPLKAVCFLSRSAAETAIVFLSPGEATIHLAAALLDVERHLDAGITVLGRLATTVPAFRLCYAGAVDGAARLETALVQPALASEL
jgi:hypothetical protein